MTSQAKAPASSVIELDRYRDVRLILPATLPPISRAEAAKASARLWRKFAPKIGRFDPPRVRRCWIATKPQGNDVDNGWARLVHDISHRVFRRVYRNTRRPHDPLHARYESDIARYVVEQGWLGGSLKPEPKATPSLNEKRARALTQTEAAISRWESKQRRAKNALRKLETKRRRLVKLLSSPTNPKE